MYSIGVKAPLTLVTDPKAHEPNSQGVNSQVVAFSGTTNSSGSRLEISICASQAAMDMDGSW
jgi:hypothetical protein